MKKFKVFVLCSFIILSLATSSHANKKTTPWENICEKQENVYCSDIDKAAYDSHNGIKLGKIIGVTYRPKGSNIGLSNPRPSPRNAFYYIIDDGMPGMKPFIRQCREIDAK